MIGDDNDNDLVMVTTSYYAVLCCAHRRPLEAHNVSNSPQSILLFSNGVSNARPRSRNGDQVLDYRQMLRYFVPLVPFRCNLRVRGELVASKIARCGFVGSTTLGKGGMVEG